MANKATFIKIIVGIFAVIGVLAVLALLGMVVMHNSMMGMMNAAVPDDTMKMIYGTAKAIV